MYTAALLFLSLCFIGANKVVCVFSEEKVIMFDIFLLGHDSLLHHRITRISMRWFHKNKVHGACFLCGLLMLSLTYCIGLCYQ